MKQGISAGYRVAVASRALAAIVGGYALAAVATGCLSLALVHGAGLPRAEAVLTATLLSFLWYGVAVVWVFAADSVWRAWLGLLVPCALLGLGWLTMRGM